MRISCLLSPAQLVDVLALGGGPAGLGVDVDGDAHHHIYSCLVLVLEGLALGLAQFQMSFLLAGISCWGCLEKWGQFQFFFVFG